MWKMIEKGENEMKKNEKNLKKIREEIGFRKGKKSTQLNRPEHEVIYSVIGFKDYSTVRHR